MCDFISIIISIVSATGILGIGTRAMITRMKHQEDRQNAIELGVQALLRERLLHNYNKYEAYGYAPIYAKENFENMYMQYRGLGGNGVMTEIHNTFMKLPTEKEGSK